jgi:phosphoribosylglycinamide formyltransferase-1
VTIHVVDEGVDTGPQLKQAEVLVLPGETEAQLHERIKLVERDLLVDVVREFAQQKTSLPA